MDETNNTTPAPAAAPQPPPAPAAPAAAGDDKHLDRRLHEGRAAGREGAGGRARAELEEAGEADDRRRHRAAHASSPASPRRTSPSARRPHDRHRRQPEAGEADGHRVERHGARREPRWRQADRSSASTRTSAGTRVRCSVRRRSTSDGRRLTNSIHDRLPLPPRRRGVRRRPRRRRRAGAGGGRRSARSCILVGRRRRRKSRGAARVRALWPDVRFAVGVHPHQAGQFAGRPAAAPRVRRRGHRSRRRRARSARSASTTTTTSRRATCSRTSFARRSRWRCELGAAGRHPHPRGRGRHVRASSREAGRGACAACSTASPATRRWRGAALDIGLLPLACRHRHVPEARTRCARSPRIVPADRLLVETDSPYLAPVPHRGKRNEPACVARVVEALAALRGVPASELAAQATRNFDAPVRPVQSQLLRSERLSALTPRAKLQYSERPTCKRHPLTDTRRNPSSPPIWRRSSSPIRDDLEAVEQRVRPPHPVAGRADPRDRQLHPEERRQARAARRCC